MSKHIATALDDFEYIYQQNFDPAKLRPDLLEEKAERVREALAFCDRVKNGQYVLRTGKWGMYVHDLAVGEDIDMERVRDLLNATVWNSPAALRARLKELEG